MTIKFNTKKFERDLNKSLNKVLQDKVEQIKIKNEVESRGNSMKLLNDVEKEFLKIILDSENVDYNYKGADEKFPEYIYRQRKKLFSILEECGYIASYSIFVDGFWEATLTPLGINYFDKEEEYRMMNERSMGNINISTLNANGSNINFGNVFDSNFNITSSYEKISKQISEEAEEKDKEELQEILNEVKDYVDNIIDTKTVGKNTSLFNKIGKHVEKYQWFYQTLTNLVGNAVITAMGNK